MKFDECPGQQPHHKMGMQLESLETSIQYMGSNILMQSMSQLQVALHDEWRRQHDHEHEEVCGEHKPPRKSTQRSLLRSRVIDVCPQDASISINICTTYSALNKMIMYHVHAM